MAVRSTPSISNYEYNGTIYWRYSNGSNFPVEGYDYNQSGSPWVHCLYSLDGSKWYQATSSHFEKSSLSSGQTITYAIVWLDLPGDLNDGTYIPSYSYSKSSYTKQQEVVPQTPFSIGVNADNRESVFVYYDMGRDSNTVYMRLYRADGVYLGEYKSNSSGITIPVTLSPDTGYYFQLRSISWTDTYSPWSGRVDFRTRSDRPPDCAIFNFKTGDTMETSKNSNGTFNAYVMSYWKWNDFCDQINVFRSYKGCTKYPFTRVSRDTNFTSTVYNEAVTTITQIITGSISSVSGGDYITAERLMNLQRQLNTVN